MCSLEEPLSKREQEVYSELLKGKTYTEIADNFHVAKTTVKTHVQRIFNKKLVSSLRELLCLRIRELEEKLDGVDRKTNRIRKENDWVFYS